MLFDESLGDQYERDVGNFMCATRSSDGGFYVMVDISIDGESVHLFKMDANVSGFAGVHRIPTSPSFDEAQEASDETLLFRYCSIAEAPSGGIYILSFDQLWRVQ